VALIPINEIDRNTSITLPTAQEIRPAKANRDADKNAPKPNTDLRDLQDTRQAPLQPVAIPAHQRHPHLTSKHCKHAPLSVSSLSASAYRSEPPVLLRPYVPAVLLVLTQLE
jgi:hypothetical protein